MTTMKDFLILSKIGKLESDCFSFLIMISAGDGAYSEVYKVKRNSDGQVYALKKVI